MCLRARVAKIPYFAGAIEVDGSDLHGFAKPHARVPLQEDHGGDDSRYVRQTRWTVVQANDARVGFARQSAPSLEPR
jgi:hypothetical protein